MILNHSRRQVVHFAVTAHPTTAWVIQQLREAMPFGQQPTYLFRDNDGIYGVEVDRFLAGSGIEEVKTAHRCPWQNPFVERYGGTLRRELLDHVIVLNEEHLNRLLKEFIEEYYHLARPHQGLNGDTPVPGELIRWQVLDQCNIVTFSSPDRLDFSFLFLNVTDLKGIRAGRHFRPG